MADTALYRAVRALDCDGIQAALAAGAHPCSVDLVQLWDGNAVKGETREVRVLAALRILLAARERASPAAARTDDLNAALGATFLNRAPAGIVKALLDACADVHAADPEYGPPICRAERPDVLRVLLAAGADPRARGTRFGITPLHSVVHGHDAKERCQAIALLVAAGADVNAVMECPRRWAPLHSVVGLVARVPSAEAVRALVDAGADPTIADSVGRTPLDLIQLTLAHQAARLPVHAFRKTAKAASVLARATRWHLRRHLLVLVRDRYRDRDADAAAADADADVDAAAASSSGAAGGLAHAAADTAGTASGSGSGTAAAALPPA